MAAISWTDVTDIAPELTTFGANAQVLVLAYVNDALNVKVFDGEDGPRTKSARVYLAAHFAAMITRANNNKTGAVSAESLGPQSTQYAAMAGVLSDRIQSTQYGILYQFLVNTSQARGPRIP